MGNLSSKRNLSSPSTSYAYRCSSYNVPLSDHSSTYNGYLTCEGPRFGRICTEKRCGFQCLFH